ncbi:hypothetical protein BH11PLA1_BH11PLA1_02080 [soil metagenome]
MAGNFNKVMLMGRLTRDPEVRHTPSNVQITKIGLAVTRKWKDAQGQMQEEPLFVDCDAFGKTAESIAKFFTKGKPIFIEGHLRLDQWQDKQTNEKKSKLKIVIETFQFTESRAGGGGGAPGGDEGGGYDNMDNGGGGAPPARQGGARVVTRPQAQAASQVPEMGDDDIPF